MQKLISKLKNPFHDSSCIDGSSLQDSRTGNIHYIIRSDFTYEELEEILKLNKIIKLQELYNKLDDLFINQILEEELPAELFFQMAKIIKRFFKNSDLKLEIKADPNPDVDDILSITICKKESYESSDFQKIKTLDSLLYKIQEETKRIIPNLLINLEYI